MLINEPILETHFEPLESSDVVETALKRMEEEKVTALPVVDQTTKKLIGQVEYDQLNRLDEQTAISDIDLKEAVKIYQGQHVFEATRLMLQYEQRLLPVVDKEWTYIGTLTKEMILESLSRMLNLAKSGSVITVELEPVDFLLSEIVQIIENEGAKILGITVETIDSVDDKLEVSLKLNVEDVSRVTAALRRYDYSVLTESGSTVFGEDLEDRADELLNYIDM